MPETRFRKPVAEVDRAAWRKKRAELLSGHRIVTGSASAEAVAAEGSCQATRLITRLLDAAIALARARGHALDSAETEDLLDAALSIGDGMRLAVLYGNGEIHTLKQDDVTPSQVRAALALTSRADPNDLLGSIRRSGRLKIDRTTFEGAVARYLDGDLREPEVDAVMLTCSYGDRSSVPIRYGDCSATSTSRISGLALSHGKQPPNLRPFQRKLPRLQLRDSALCAIRRG